MASDVDICNAAALKVGASSIVSLTEDSVVGRAMNAAYDRVRRRELRKHRWNFAIKRTQLAADSTAPTFGYARSFTLPSDFIKWVPWDKGSTTNNPDFVIEGRSLLTDDAAPYNLRYIWNVTDVNVMDDSFREVLACALAVETCEKITQSNVKKEDKEREYKDAMAEASKADAFEKMAPEPPTDTWETVRQ